MEDIWIQIYLHRTVIYTSRLTKEGNTTKKEELFTIIIILFFFIFSYFRGHESTKIK